MNIDRCIAWDKGTFIGREAAQNAPAPTQILRMIEIDANGADPMGFEPLRKDGAVIGTTTSGGYGYRMQASYAMALVNVEHADIGNDIIVDVVGEQCQATIIDMSPYDPTGSRMRS